MEPRNVLFVGSEDAERTVALAGALADLIATTGWSPRLAVAVAGVSTGAGEAGAERVHDLESDDGPLARADVVVTDSTESAADLVPWQAMRRKHVIAVAELEHIENVIPTFLFAYLLTSSTISSRFGLMPPVGTF